MASKPNTPQGTRDFGPEEVGKREYLFHVLKHAFKRFGYQPIETPTMELTSTLMGKYGEEGDRLIFKVLPRGEKLQKALSQADQQGFFPTDEALRYDLTVPFARYVVQHRNEINLPFKRYQIQPVWRADRPQKGRYREFFQCDADVVGSNSLWQEVELTQLYDQVFSELGLHVTIKLNHRQILTGLAQLIGAENKLIDFTVALDKLDKIGVEGVEQEMLDRGIPAAAIDQVRPVLQLSGSAEEKLNQLERLFAGNSAGLKGVEELRFITEQVAHLGLQMADLELDLTLARGLNYYTGTIFEVVSNEVKLGSIGGGGRYDNLTGIFGWEGLSGVGISFGLDRIYLVMEELDKFPKAALENNACLFINFGTAEAAYAMRFITTLRREGATVDLYPDAAKVKKQFDFANKAGFTWVALAGEEEMNNQTVDLKHLPTGVQEVVDLEGLVAKLR